MKVYPRQPDEASTLDINPGMVYIRGFRFTDAEFAAAFRPAEHLEQLVACLVVLREAVDAVADTNDPGWSMEHYEAVQVLRDVAEEAGAALRQWEAS